MDRIEQGSPLHPTPLVRETPAWQKQREQKKHDRERARKELEKKQNPPKEEENPHDSGNLPDEDEDRGANIDIQV